MGREVRMVPADWEHPKNDQGRYRPLLDGNFIQAVAEWEEGNAKWAVGLREDNNGGWQPIGEDIKSESYEEWAGARPVEEDYMPAFADGTATHYMMYETTSEGTPISPAFETPELLARWLTDTNASSFGSMGAPYEAWLRVCKGGYAPSAVMDSQGFRSGVEL